MLKIIRRGELWLTFLADFILIILDVELSRVKDGGQNRRFVKPTGDEQKLTSNVQKRLYHLETWISLIKFE
jgi:hypothetical protein